MSERAYAARRAKIEQIANSPEPPDFDCKVALAPSVNDHLIALVKTSNEIVILNEILKLVQRQQRVEMDTYQSLLLSAPAPGTTAGGFMRLDDQMSRVSRLNLNALTVFENMDDRYHSCRDPIDHLAAVYARANFLENPNRERTAADRQFFAKAMRAVELYRAAKEILERADLHKDRLFDEWEMEADKEAERKRQEGEGLRQEGEGLRQEARLFANGCLKLKLRMRCRRLNAWRPWTVWGCDGMEEPTSPNAATHIRGRNYNKPR